MFNKVFAGIVLLAVGTFHSAYAQILFQDNFDNAEYLTLQPGDVFGPTGAQWKFYINRAPFLATGKVLQTNGRLHVNTNVVGGGLDMGDGIQFVTPSAPQFSFFGTPGQTTPNMRIYSIRGLQFGRDELGQATTSPVHFNNLAFLISSVRGDPTFASYFRVYLSGLNNFSVTSRESLRTRDLAVYPFVYVPMAPNGFDVMLDATNYKVTFLFQGGGLYFEGQHGLTRATWESHAAPWNVAPGENFYPYFIGYTGTRMPGDTRSSTFSIDSFSVSDGN